jgi:hypothetical protein
MNHQNLKSDLADDLSLFSPLELLGFALLYPITSIIITPAPNAQHPTHHPYHA